MKHIGFLINTPLEALRRNTFQSPDHETPVGGRTLGCRYSRNVYKLMRVRRANVCVGEEKRRDIRGGGGGEGPSVIVWKVGIL